MCEVRAWATGKSAASLPLIQDTLREHVVNSKWTGEMTNGKAHKQATRGQIAELRARLDDLEANGKNAMVARYRWYLTDRVLHRFITARNGDLELALKMILDHLVRFSHLSSHSRVGSYLTRLQVRSHDPESLVTDFNFGSRRASVFTVAAPGLPDTKADVQATGFECTGMRLILDPYAMTSNMLFSP